MTVVKTQGTVLQGGDGGGPEVFTTIAQVLSVNGIGSGAPTEIDITQLSDTFKRYLMGLKDSDEITLTLMYDPGDATQTALRTEKENQTLRNYKLVLVDTGATEISFAAYVKTFEIGVEMDDKLTLDVTMRLDQGATWT